LDFQVLIAELLKTGEFKWLPKNYQPRK
jgi:hypothetical protein